MSCQNKYVFYESFPIIKLNNSCGENSIVLDCDRCNIYKKSFIGSGGYNSTFFIETQKCQNSNCQSSRNNNGVLRLSHKYLDSDEIFNEKLGLYLQALFSLSKNKKGKGCKHICKVYDFGEYEVENKSLANNIFKCGNKDKSDCKSINFEEDNFDKGVYGILENIPGGDLFDRLLNKSKKFQSFNEKDVGNMMGQLLLALYCMHSNGFVHLDIKPENILLKDKKRDNNIRLIDFGFVNYVPENPGYIDPSNFGRAGTPTYKAPEVNFDSRCDQKADIWSVGVTTLVLLLMRTNYDDVSEDKGEFTETIIPTNMFNKYNNELSNYSLECNDFLKKTIVWEPEKRLSSEECLNHPWIKKNCPEAKKFIEKSINKKNTTKFTNKKKSKISSKKSSKKKSNPIQSFFKSWLNEL